MQNGMPEAAHAAQDMSLVKNTPTYDFLMAQNILSKFNIHLQNNEILKILKEKNDIYFCILRAPTENVFNQIIFSQIKSYELFTQKRMLDFVIKTAPSTNDLEGREGIEPELPEVFNHLQNEFQRLQKKLIELDNQLLKQVSLTNAYLQKFLMQRASLGVVFDRKIPADLEEKVHELQDQAREMRGLIISIREEWSLFAKMVCKSLSELGGYYIDEETDQLQRSEIDFFRDLGQ